MEILSSYNLFNKKHKIPHKENKPGQKLTLKLLEDKLLALTPNNKKTNETDKNNNSPVYLNEQFIESFKKPIETMKKPLKNSLSSRILNFEQKDLKNKAFLPIILDFPKEKPQKMKKFQRKINEIMIEENPESFQKKGNFSNVFFEGKNEEKSKEKKQKKTGFSNAKYFKNLKNSKEFQHNYSCSFPNLSNLLISSRIPMKTPINKEEKLKIEIEEDSYVLKSIILLEKTKKKAKFRDEEENTRENEEINKRKIIKF